MSNDRKTKIPLAVTIPTFFVMVACAMFLVVPANVQQDPRVMLLFPLFPLGLMWPTDSPVSSNGAGFLLTAFSLFWAAICIAAYPAMLFVFCKFRTTKGFVTACLILALILIANVKGCQTMLRNPALHGPE